MNTGPLISKFVIILGVLAFALANLFPVTETPFEDYVAAQVTAHHEDFEALAERVRARVQESQEQVAAEEGGIPQSFFIALRETAREERIDLTRFFPHLPLEASMINIDQRNATLLRVLLERSQPNLKLGLDLRGGVSLVFQVQEHEAADLDSASREEQMAKAVQIIRSRADGFGVADPVIRIVGDNRIEVQLPGLSLRENPDIVEEFRKPALLEFRLVHRTMRPGTTPPGEDPPGYVRMVMEDVDREGNFFEREYFVTVRPELTGRYITRATARQSHTGVGYEVHMEFDSDGARLFEEVTERIARENRGDNIGQLAIVLDNELYSAPTVQQRIGGGRAQITGRFTLREARELANVLNNPLELPLELMESSEVGPTLAADSITQSRNAMLYGAIAVIIFMLIYYLISGFLACITLGLNVVIILGVLSSLGATLTLPGIAGIVLTLGMAVDANILVFERIREEIRAGKKIALAIPTGFNKALSTILDANITTLLTAAVLIYFGSGPVKGFGVTLAIGIFTSIFGALVITRLFMDLLLKFNLLEKLKMLSFFSETSIDFLKYRKPMAILSLTVLVIGMVAVGMQRENVLGIDFLGGSEIVLEFDPNHRLTTTEIQDGLSELAAVTPVYQQPFATERESLRIQTLLTDEAEINALVALLVETFPETFPKGLAAEEGRTTIGATIGSEILRDAVIAIIISLIGILFYVAFRFEMGYGVGAVAAIVHDLLIVIGLFVLSGRQFSAPMVAGILMVVGYSLNDTIVVFDRIREELTLDPNSKLRKIINTSINRVLARTVVTSITTMLAAGSLFLFGGGVINDFSFTFLCGIIVGTFSSIFIASPVFYWWHKGDRRHVEERKDILPKYEWMATTAKKKDRGEESPA